MGRNRTGCHAVSAARLPTRPAIGPAAAIRPLAQGPPAALQTTDDADRQRRQQTPTAVTSLAPYTMCRWASKHDGNITCGISVVYNVSQS